MPTYNQEDEDVNSDRCLKELSTPSNVKEGKESWAKYTPSMLRTPRTKSLRMSERKESLGQLLHETIKNTTYEIIIVNLSGFKKAHETVIT